MVLRAAIPFVFASGRPSVCTHPHTLTHTVAVQLTFCFQDSNGGRQHFKGRKDNTLKKTPPQLSHLATWLPAHPILLEPWLMALEEL